MVISFLAPSRFSRANLDLVATRSRPFEPFKLQWPALSWYAVGLCFAAFFIAGSLLPYERIN